jgi:hypothetical protein
MFIVFNRLQLSKDSKLAIFILKSSAVKFYNNLPNKKNYFILQANFKVVNDIVQYLKTMFTVEKQVILEPVLEPVVTPVAEPIQEPVVQEPLVQESTVQQTEMPAAPIDEVK